MRLASLGVAGLTLAFVALLVIAYVSQPHEQWDFMTYPAAGERLNAGHFVYTLVPGDPPVTMQPPFVTGPLLPHGGRLRRCRSGRA